MLPWAVIQGFNFKFIGITVLTVLDIAVVAVEPQKTSDRKPSIVRSHGGESAMMFSAQRVFKLTTPVSPNRITDDSGCQPATRRIGAPGIY